MNSLRRRLSVYLLLGVGVLLVATALVQSLVVSSFLERTFDESLRTKAHALESLSKLQGDEATFALTNEALPEFKISEHPEYFQMWRGDGSALTRSQSLRDHPTFDLPRDVLQDTAERFANLRLPDGRRGRLVQVHFGPAADGALDRGEVTSTQQLQVERHQIVTLVVATGREDLDRQLWIFHLVLAGVVVLLLVVIASLVRLSLSLGLRPLDEMTRQVRGLDARHLGARLKIAAPPAELHPVLDQLNALLERLQEAFDRERRLSSNVAHELRTPIAELRNLAEVGIRWPDKRDMVLQFFEDVRAISLQMEKTVSNLLALARFDSGLEIVRKTPVKMEDVVDSAWRQLARQGATRGIVLATQITPSLTLHTDPDKLELMLLNLLGNAVNYSPENSTIRTFNEEISGRLTLTVANLAERLQPEDLPMLFDRFWRKDPARTGGKHSGLGLALVRAFAELLGIEIAVELDDEKYLHVRLIFPQPTSAA